MPELIESYAVIGNCETVALVGRDGSIDWLGLPRFDSTACFAALLGGPENGRWQIAPSSSPLQVTRRYQCGLLFNAPFSPPLDPGEDLHIGHVNFLLERQKKAPAA